MKGKYASGMRLFCCTAFLVVASGPVWGLTAARGLVKLGGLTDNNYIWSTAEDVSNDGTLVVGYSEINSGRNECFMYTDGSIFHMGFLNSGDPMSRALGISADGSIIVGESTGTGFPEAVRWFNGLDTPSSMGFINNADTTTWGSRATAISHDGRLIVGEGEHGNFLHAFIKIGEDMLRSINPPGVAGLKAEDVANSGTVVGSHRLSYYSNEYHPFRWHGNVEDLENLNNAQYYEDFVTNNQMIEGTTSGEAYAVSADGTVVVGQARSPMDATPEEFNWAAFRWENGQMMELGHLLQTHKLSAANDVSADGNIVVGFSTISRFANSSDREATVWIGGDDGNYPAISLNEWADNNGIDREEFRMEEARAISPSGRFIVGYGRNDKGQHEAFLLVFSEHGSWAGWPVEADQTTVATGSFLQEVDVAQTPWVFVHRINGWVHVLPEHINRKGAWVYMPLESAENLLSTGEEGSEWEYSNKLKTWLHKSSADAGKNGDYTYFPF
jgi:probable HAF family extracellular repeat protein